MDHTKNLVRKNYSSCNRVSLSSCEEEIANAEKAGSDMEKELASLGFFSFSKKNSLKKAILENDDKKTQLAEKKKRFLKSMKREYLR